MTRTEIAFALWLVPWAVIAVLSIARLCPLSWVYGYGLGSVLLAIAMALSRRLRQLAFLIVWRLGVQGGCTPRAEEQQARDHVPELFKEAGRLLYVGANPTRTRLIDVLWRAGHEITLLEIWPPNAAYFADDRRFKHIVCGDVRDVPKGLPHESYDVVVWWHGPEHVLKQEAFPTLAALEALAKLGVLGMPWGTEPTGPSLENPGYGHVSGWYAEDLAAVGYSTALLEEERATYRHMLAWKRRA